MATDLLYNVSRVGSGKTSKRDTLAAGLDLFQARARTLTAPFQLRVNGADWGQERLLRDAMARTKAVVKNGDAGTIVAIRGSKEADPHFVLKVTIESKGHLVVKAAISQLGAPYIWAEIDPKGPEGGPGSGFDCSGLCVWCYDQVHADLPHNSEAIRQMLQQRGGLFRDKAKVKPGDLVFFHTDDRNGPNAASHIAICSDKDRMIVAPHTGSVVQRQAINSVSGFMSFGFLKSVTGAH